MEKSEQAFFHANTLVLEIPEMSCENCTGEILSELEGNLLLAG